MSTERKDKALQKRIEAAHIATNRDHPEHAASTDKTNLLKQNGAPSYLMNFTKGLMHDPNTGLAKSDDEIRTFQEVIASGDVVRLRALCDHRNQVCVAHERPSWHSELARTGNAGQRVPFRAWESLTAGFAFDLEGPDAQAVTMPAAFDLGDVELTAEMAEIYAQALLRDVPLTAFNNGTNSIPFVSDQDQTKVAQVLAAIRTNMVASDRFSTVTFSETSAFRGSSPGDDVGPYLSQFLLMGSSGINGNDREQYPFDGRINYGAQIIDQRVRSAVKGKDYMQRWDEYLDVQDGADLRGKEEYDYGRKFIVTGRDLSTYVHYDALYQAYLNACILLLGAKIDDADGLELKRFNPDIPYQGEDFFDRQQGFAHFGGPHILTLVTEVATRALKAVRYQKFQNHLRLRPEALAARIQKLEQLQATVDGETYDKLHKMRQDLTEILALVHEHNSSAGSEAVDENYNYLLPMAFAEGSPMHPAYGAGHATVAGACVTILKAFFNSQELYLKLDNSGTTFELTSAERAGSKAFVASSDGQRLEVVDSEALSLEGELNKLAANIAIGRDWAGVHYFTDYSHSMAMGEEIAIGILEEQMLTYQERFRLKFTKFNGEECIIEAAPPHPDIEANELANLQNSAPPTPNATGARDKDA